jgi:hypothetical protein
MFCLQRVNVAPINLKLYQIFESDRRLGTLVMRWKKKNSKFHLKKVRSGDWRLVELTPDFIQWRISLLSVTNLSFHVNSTLTKHGARRTVNLYMCRGYKHIYKICTTVLCVKKYKHKHENITVRPMFVDV